MIPSPSKKSPYWIRGPPFATHSRSPQNSRDTSNIWVERGRADWCSSKGGVSYNPDLFLCVRWRKAPFRVSECSYCFCVYPLYAG
jgi:hypothetical protein